MGSLNGGDEKLSYGMLADRALKREKNHADNC